MLSILSDYSEVAPEGIVDVSYELAKAGFKMHDMTSSRYPDLRGVFIYRWQGKTLKPVALMKTPRKIADGVAVDICRFDRGNRIDTFEVKLTASCN